MIETIADRDGDSHLFPIRGFQLLPFHGVPNFLVGLDHVDCDDSIQIVHNNNNQALLGL